VDDDRDLRESLLALLAALGRRARGFASAEDFRARYDSTQRGCLILDIRMPGQNGLDLYTDLLREGHRLPVIFITAHADVSTAVAAMKTGAIEFLEKPFSQATLSDRIEKALQLDAQWRSGGERYREMDMRIRQLRSSDRETLQFILAGMTNKAMAAQLFITERAVELRRQRLMQRLAVRTVPELLEMAITHRVLSEVRMIQGCHDIVH
jgi:FixJ family two-component response regulator